jgi:hydroxymethylpyrimidine pyrophosphatase-like HAD family hydrolase
MKKLICFDLDGTLTQHRSPLEKASKDLLDALSKKYKVIMVGAGGCERIYKQMGLSFLIGSFLDAKTI